MTPLRPFDFFLAGLLLVGLALWARREYAQLTRAIGSRHPRARMHGYRRTLVTQWSIVSMLAVHWIWLGRDPSALHLQVQPSLALWVTLGVVAVLTGFLLWQLRDVATSAEARVETLKALESLRALLPHDIQELRLFTLLGITAGICEEILYRGFLPWFLMHWMSEGVAFGVAVVAFGLGHLYQGRVGVIKTMAVGLVMALIVWWSQSLLPAILLHVAIDVINGRLTFVALTTVDEVVEPEGPSDL